MINELDALIATRHWFCVWCQSHYQGEKHCKTCNTGIYSISRGDWAWNYSLKDIHGVKENVDSPLFI
ncbi:putative zinc ribbon protein [Klebsiella michiganensis]|uniref:putative zinc ribbon protein n=1 Tax=Klebsiella michiganensis TaxID=1134687 RepID=UPI003F663E14